MPQTHRTPGYSDLPELDGKMPSTEKLRTTLTDHGYEWKCSECDIHEWQGRKAPLQVDHIDGNRLNNRLDNLRFLCPNCHALTDTYGSRNRKIRRDQFVRDNAVATFDRLNNGGDTPPTLSQLFSAMGLRARVPTDRATVNSVLEPAGRKLRTTRLQSSKTKIHWPADDVLAQMLTEESRLQVAKKLGVSDTAIKKRCAKRNIQEPTYRRQISPPPKVKVQSEAEKKRNRAIKSREARLKKLETKHGTRAGYHLERRLGLETCTACRKANALDAAATRKATKP